MSARFAFMLVLVPILLILTMRKPLFGLYATIVMYYFRPDIWDQPSWWQPVFWLTLATIISWGIRAKTIRMPGIMLCAIAVIPGMVLSSLTAFKSQDVSMAATVVVIKLVIAMFLVVQLLRTMKDVLKFLWMNVIANLWTLKSVVLITATGGDASRANVAAAQGGGANYLAMTFVMALPLLYFRYLHGSPREKKFAFWLSPFMLFGIMGTGSRGGFLTMFIIMVLMAIRSKQLVKGFSTIFVMVIFFYIVTPQAKLDRFMTTFETKTEKRGFAANSRLDLWKAGWQMFMSSPITGVGHDNYQLLSPRYTGYFAGKTPRPYRPELEGTKGYRGFVAHSTWFQTLADGGMVSAVPFFGLFILCYFSLRRMRRLPLPPAEKKEAYLISQIYELTLLAFIIASTFGSHMKIDFLWWYFGGVAAFEIIVKKQMASWQHQQRATWMQSRAQAAAASKAKATT
ncbi:MAG: O-antigen ligase [Planctomycetota bacterium]|jgi:O-antigen ligase